MKKKKASTVSLSKDELQKQLKLKNSALAKMKREQQIEAALEQVRARTMAMQKSDELQEAATVLFQQMKSLGVQTGSCGFNIWEKDGKAATAWMSSAEGALQAPFKMPHTESTIYKQAYKAMKNGKDFFVKKVAGKVLKKHFDYLLTVAGISNVIQYLRETSYSFPETMVYHFVFFNNGYLSFHLHEHHPETHNIFKRFAKVFEQTYTRFLDLQKAEAQAREAQIEAALERVRSRTMAMQKSEELKEVIQLVYEQFVHLNIHIEHTGFLMDYKARDDMHIWLADQHLVPADVTIPFFDSPPNNSIKEAKEKGQDFFEYHLTFEEKNKFYRDLFGFVPGVPEETSEYYFNCPGLAGSGVLLDSIGLYIENFSGIPYNDEDNKTLMRFGKVFQQTYTRFNDLQKAEAQAREAQIELSLERVRAKTMAMHNSQHVAETVATLFDELVKLGIDKTTRSGIAIIGDKKDMEIWTASSGANGQIGMDIGRIDLMMHPMIMGFYQSWKNKESNYTYDFVGEDLKEYFKAVNQSPDYPVQFDLNALPSKLIHSSFFFPEGALYAFSQEPLTAEASKIFKRFAGVFSQTYRRFLDLQKAEAQARSAQIEAAMEKVRARSLAMQQPEELIEVAEVLRKEMGSLGVEELETSSIYIIDEEKRTAECWYAIKDVREGDKKLVSDHMIINLNDTWVGREMQHFYSSGEKQSSILMQGENRKEWINYCAAHSKVLQGYYGDEVPERTYHLLKFSNGYIGAASPGNISTESWDLLQRATNVFSFAYTRFQDLQNAEIRAREGQIELALERVRARTMAMFKSDELAETAAILIGQLNVLGIEPISLYIGIIKDKTGDMEIWSTDENGKEIDKRYVANIHKNSSIKKMYDVWIAKEKSVALDMQGDELENWLAYWREEHQLHFNPGQSLHRRVQNIAYFSKGFIAFTSPDEQPPSTINLLERFASVFNLTYTRFTDLQQAETQAREARIEASLERVRSKAMAMHSSKDLADTVIAFYRELESLSVTPRRCGVGLINKETQSVEISSMNTTEEGDSIAVIGNIDLRLHPILIGIYDNWLLQKDYYPVLRGSEIKEYYQILTPQINYPDYPYDVVQYGYFFFFAEGGVYAWTEKQMTENELKIYHRFTSVLTLTYKRYKDLKQAEEQAREATIEAALEKVRGKAMAMRTSEDLSSAASMVFTELRKLGINPIRSGVGIISKESRQVQFYSAMSSPNGDSLSLTGGVIMSGHPEFEKQYESWVRKENHFIALKGEELKSYYKFLFAGFNIDSEINIEDDQEQYGHWLMFSEGFLFAWSYKAYSEAEINILERFKKIVELTFRRYIELQKSEANAREAVKQAALDRVRADIASMRTTKDLERITPLIWNELTVLGIPFIRCGVFIMDEEQQQIHIFLSTPDGKAIAAFHLPYDTPGNFAEVVSHWHQKKKYVSHWGQADFLNLADSLVQQGAIATQEQYISSMPKEGIHLHFLPFLQGMLYVGNNVLLNDDALQLVQNLADAFSTAYARYEDFNKLEAAKQTVEKTLVDLKQAQQQLIQSEKMASLGELTAGIAHEIQNPLNFVNNFSEVNVELIGELVAEVDKGNTDEAKAIANDIRENSEKINHHGKRADGIVKGMLQHSRSSSGQKEPTDINVLTDEYLRLCYHGLRAKDKSFNATIKTDFDNTIKKINIIPQDIGRVILNLLTNAFYAVNEKKQKNIEGYSPTVSVTTKQSGNQVSIIVSDNGNGIPQKVVDKIFQPFFTTKPTGQGTGLGLSLSYDIVKAHGGEIKVATRDGEGSEFVIQLPVV